MNVLRRAWRRIAGDATAVAALLPRGAMRVARGASAMIPRKQDRDPVWQNPWQQRQYPPGVGPQGADRLAMDELSADSRGWGGAGHGAWAEGIGFLGYPYLAELTQRSEYRRPCEIIAEEMTRKWIRLQSTGKTDKSAKIRALDDAMLRFGLRERFHDTVLQDGFFGLSFLLIDVGTSDNETETLTPLTLTPEKIAKGSLKGFHLIDPTWSAPNWYEATRPWRPNFYKPDTWYLMGQRFHRSRLLITVSRPVPDLLKPVYNFGGISAAQMLKPYVDNWLRTRQSVSDIIQAFTVFVLETDMSALLTGEGGSNLIERAEYFTKMRNNLGLMMTDKEREAFQNVSAPLSGLDHLQAQAQEHQASAIGLPLIKMFGLSPSGLNATADNEVRVLYDMIHARQQRVVGDNLTTALKILQLNEFGEIDPEIEFEFVGLWELDDAGKAAVQKTKADVDAVLIESGILTPDDARQRLASDPESSYQGLEGDAPGLPEEPEEPDLSDPAEHIEREGAEGSETGASSGV